MRRQGEANPPRLKYFFILKNSFLLATDLKRGQININEVTCGGKGENAHFHEYFFLPKYNFLLATELKKDK